MDLSRNIIASWFVWLTATRTAKLLPHLWYRPSDIIYVPAFILFGYYFAIMKLYALFTLHEVRNKSLILRDSDLNTYMQTGWGTRAGIGDISAATAAMDQSEKPQQDQFNSQVDYPRPQPVS